MRLSSVAILAGTFAVAAAACAVAAVFSVRVVEQSSIAGVERRLTGAGIDWAGVDANGLQVFVHGTAPTEADRFRAISAAGKVVDAARVIDETLVEETEDIVPPRFSVEILRNEDEVQLIGLVPAAYDRAALIESVQDIVGGPDGVSDLLETADFPVPAGWEAAMDLATLALEDLPRSKISAATAEVSVQAMTGSAEERREVSAALEGAAPESVELTLDLTAPRPVISPFTLRFVIDDQGARFDSCAADTQDAKDAILAAARKAGATGSLGCVVGLGVPSPAWGDAAANGIAALAALGGGELVFSNADISLIAAQGTEPDTFDTVVGDLEAALADPFVLDAVLPEPEDPDANEGPTEFVATLDPEGRVQLRGRMKSEMSRTTADSYARARFGSEAVRVGTRIDEDLPDGWSARVLAGLEALSMLATGEVRVTTEAISVSGETGDTEASAAITALLSEKLPDGSREVDVTYVEKLDPTLGIPTPAECVDQVRQIIGARKITFEPGSATLDVSAKEILDEVAELLKVCGDIPLEIQGHTDSQGREVMNQQLSQQRAEAVLGQLRQRRVLTASYSATGYGEEEPIADNDTEAGREANRRIEFHLIEPAVPSDETPPEGVEYPDPTGDEALTEAAATDEADTRAEEGPEDEQD